MKRFWLIFIGLSALLIATPASAVLFTRPSGTDDFAYVLINYIFNVETGTGSILIPKMLEVFSSIIVVVATVFVAYTSVVGTLYTAHEGELLGRKWSSMFIPFRIAAGVALLIPKASTGYSLIQTFILYIVLQGMGAANALWETAVKTSVSAGTVGQVQFQGPIASAFTSGLTSSEGLYRILVCRNAINRIRNGNTISIKAELNATQGSRSIIHVGGREFGRDACGVISWPNTGTPSLIAARNQAAEDLIDVLNQDANDHVNSPGNRDSETIPRAVRAFISIVSVEGAKRDLELGTTTKGIEGQRTFEELTRGGWLSAGMLYYKLLKLDSKTNIVPEFPDVTQNFSTLSLGSDRARFDAYITQADKWLQQTLHGPNPPQFDPTSNISGSRFGNLIFKTPHVDKGKSWILKIKTPLGTIKINFNWLRDILVGAANGLIKVMFAVTGPLGGLVKDFGILLDAVKQGGWNPKSVPDPLLTIQKFGADMVGTVEVLWLGGLVITVLVGILLGGMLLWIIPLFTTLLIFLYIAGSMLAYYMPAIPFVLFTFGALGWLMGVIEAVVAGPLVALGLLHPHGEELWGKSEPAIMLTIDIFLRPSLMVFGLMASIVLSRAAMLLVTHGFANMVSFLFKGGISYFTSLIALIIIYGVLVTMIMTKSYGLIHMLPDKVLRWIGGQGGFESGAQDEERVRGGFKEGHQPVGESAGKAAETGATKAGGAAAQGKGSASDLQSGGDSGGGGDPAGGGGGSGPSTEELALLA